MAVPFSNTKLRVPKGFQNILESLAREVLRSQPSHIHEFAAAYFEKMLKIRTETGHDPAIHGAKLDDRNYNNESFKKRSVDPSDPQQQQAAVTIQTQFRQHSAKGEVQSMREEDAATRIQAGFRGFIDREQVRSMKDEDAPAGGQEEEEVDIDLNDPEVEKAAIKIQAGFKGFKARKDVHGKEEEEGQAAQESAEAPRPASVEKQEAQTEEEVDIDLNDPEVAQAALKIQAGFRGHQARQEVIAHKAEREAPKPVSPLPEPEQEAQKPAAAEEEEEIDIDLNDPDVEKAAVKIQAGFKGLKARKGMRQKAEDAPAPEAAPTEPSAEQTTTTAAAAAEEEEVDIDLEDPATEKAALKIQAGFRGYQTRRDMAGKPQGEEEQQQQQQQDQQQTGEGEQKEAAEGEGENKPEEGGQQDEEKKPGEDAAEGEEKKKEEEGAGGAQEEVDIDLEDPEVEKAAMKIQAGFKGFKARKEINEKKGDSVDGGPSDAPEEQDGSKVEEEGGQVTASEEETQPKEVAAEGQGQEEQKDGGEEQKPAEGGEAGEGEAQPPAAEGEQEAAAADDKGGE